MWLGFWFGNHLVFCNVLRICCSFIQGSQKILYKVFKPGQLFEIWQIFALKWVILKGLLFIYRIIHIMNTVFFLFVEKDLINVVFVVFDVFDTIPNMLNWIVGYSTRKIVCVSWRNISFFWMNFWYQVPLCCLIIIISSEATLNFFFWGRDNNKAKKSI